MTEKKYRVHDWVKFQYSEIGEYIDENHTDRPLRNDEIVDLLNTFYEENKQLKQELKWYKEFQALFNEYGHLDLSDVDLALVVRK